MLTDQEIIEIKRKSRALDPTQQWGDTLALSRAVIAAHEAKKAQAVPQGKPVAWLDLSKMSAGAMVYATGWKSNDKQSPLYTAAPSQDPIEMTLRDYADSLIAAGHEFWKACRRDAGGGAVRWLSCDDGTLIVFTRGEYRDAIMGAVGGYRATEVVFEDQANDEQGGVVACAATSLPVTLTDGLIEKGAMTGMVDAQIDSIIAALRAKEGK